MHNPVHPQRALPATMRRETVPCPLCGSTQLEKLFDVPGDPVAEFGYFGITRCRNCGLVFTNPRPARDDIGWYYGPAYYGPKHRRFLGPLEWVETYFRYRRIRTVERFQKTGRILDIGCGRGQMLSALKKRGWEVYGTELTPESAAEARAAIGPTVLVGELTDQKFPDQYFDCVTLWYVYEHVYDPRGMVAEIARIIKPGGLLVIGVHNYGSRMARFGGRNWFNFDAPRHTVHFTLPQLHRLLAEYGFQSVRTSHLSWEYDPYCWLQTLYNRLGFEHNLLYTMIRRRDWWQKFSPGKLVQAAGVVFTLPILSIFAVLLSLLDGLGRCNGTFVDYSIQGTIPRQPPGH